MSNYMGIISDMKLEISKALSALEYGMLSDYMNYYRQELNASRYLKEITEEVNEACAIALSETLTPLKCYATFDSRNYEHGDTISFEVVSELMGSLGVIEVPNKEVSYGTLSVKQGTLSRNLKEKSISDLEKYTKHLVDIEQTLLTHGIEVQFA